MTEGGTKDVESPDPVTTRRRRSRVLLAVGLAVLVGCLAAGYVFWPSGSDDDRAQSRFCWGTLSRADVASLAPAGAGTFSSDEEPLNKGVSHLCSVGEQGDGEGEGTDESFSLAVTPAGNEWPYGVRSGYGSLLQYASYTPLGEGLNGWTSDQGAASVWLPDACREKFGRPGSREPAMVTLAVKDSQKDDWAGVEGRARMARALTKAAQKLAADKGCDSRAFVPSDGSSAVAKEKSFQQGEACGLEGFAPLRTAEAGRGRLTERVARDGIRNWSCLLERERDRKYGGSDPLVAFTATQNPQLVKEYEDEDGTDDRSLFRCDGVKTLVRTDYPGTLNSDKRALTHADRLLHDKKSLTDSFAEAFTKDHGC